MARASTRIRVSGWYYVGVAIIGLGALAITIIGVGLMFFVLAAVTGG